MTQIRPALLALVAACLSACAVEMRVIHSGIVNDTVDNAECPAGLAKTAEGYVTVFVDKGDGAAGVINFFALTRDLGKTWEKPFWTIKTDRHDPHVGGGVAFSQLRDGRILGTSTDTWHSDTSLQGVFGFRKSKVRIVTYDMAARQEKTICTLVSPEMALTSPEGNNIIELSNGDMLLPAYVYATGAPEPGFPYGSGFFRSRDGGKTWGTFERAFKEKEADPEKQLGFNESVIFEKPDHTLVCFARIDKYPSPLKNNMWKVTSSDFGKTWSAPVETDIPAAYPIGLRAKNGYYVMVCGYLKAPIQRTVTIFYSEDGEHFTRLGIPYYSRPADKKGQPYNPATGGMQAIAEIAPDKFLLTFYACDPVLSGRDHCYVDSCLFKIVK